MDVASAVAVLQENVKTLFINGEQMRTDINAIRDRLPNWAVWAFTIGGALIGSLITLCMK